MRSGARSSTCGPLFVAGTSTSSSSCLTLIRAASKGSGPRSRARIGYWSSARPGRGASSVGSPQSAKCTSISRTTGSSSFVSSSSSIGDARRLPCVRGWVAEQWFRKRATDASPSLLQRRRKKRCAVRAAAKLLSESTGVIEMRFSRGRCSARQMLDQDTVTCRAVVRNAHTGAGAAVC